MLASLLRQPRIALIIGLGIAAAPVLAKPVDQVRARVAGYKQLGAAFKAVNDALRNDDLEPAKIRQSAAAIVAASRHQYKSSFRASSIISTTNVACLPRSAISPVQFEEQHARLMVKYAV